MKQRWPRLAGLDARVIVACLAAALPAACGSPFQPPLPSPVPSPTPTPVPGPTPAAEQRPVIEALFMGSGPLMSALSG